MERQQTRHGTCASSSRPANPVTERGNSAGETFVVKGTELDAHIEAVQCVAGALDVGMLEFIEVRHSTGLFSQGILNVLVHPQSFTWLWRNDSILHLYARSAANSMNVVLGGIRDSLLNHDKLVRIVRCLCVRLKLCMQTVRTRDGEAQKDLNLQLNASGLIPAMSKFTQAAWRDLQQFNISECQQQKQRQWQLKQDAQREVAEAIIEMLLLWREMLLHAPAYAPLSALRQDVLPALIGLTAAAPAIIKKTRASTLASLDSSNPRNLNRNRMLIGYENMSRDMAANSLTLADSLWEYQQQRAVGEKVLQQQQQQQRVYLSEGLPELLLHLLAYQAGQLHGACGGVSQVLQDRHAAAAADGTRQQQDQQQQQPFAGCAVPTSHLVLLQSMCLEYQTDTDDAKAQKIQALLRKYATTVTTLRTAVLARCMRVTQLSSSRSTSSQGGGHQQQQHEHTHNVLPSHLLVPAIKVLVEVMLLLPPSSGLAVQASSLHLILLLLQRTVTSAPAAAAAAVGAGHQEDQQEAAASAGPWPQLPAAVAAGLLHPVVAQLPQAVMYCLLQTDHEQRQEVKTDWLALLHSYGSLLITVCQSVEPKHIATVLKSQSAPDLLITLAAIEAVIRAQACHLAPVDWKQQPQQEPDTCSTSSAQQRGSNNSSFGLLHDITYHPLDQAPIHLYPFVSAVMSALEDVVPVLLQEQHPLLANDTSSVRGKLSARLFTLLSTALKVSQHVVTTAAAEAGVGETTFVEVAAVIATAMEHRLQAMLAPDSIVLSMSSCVSASQDTPASMHSSSQHTTVPAMPLVMSFKAFGAWARCWSCILSSHEALAAAASGGLAGQGMTSTIPAAAHVLPTLAELLGVFSNTIYVLRNVAASQGVHDHATASTTAGVSHNQGQQSSRQCCELQLLLRQAGQVRAVLRSTIEQAILEANYPFEMSKAARAAWLASLSYERVCSILLERAAESGEEGMRPSLALLASMRHLSTSACELADTVVARHPLPICCNNPLCTNLTRLSEWQLVCGKACVCAGCGVVRYCGKSCQERHWKLHKPACLRPDAQ